MGSIVHAIAFLGWTAGVLFVLAGLGAALSTAYNACDDGKHGVQVFWAGVFILAVQASTWYSTLAVMKGE
jgi:hypothetical protein